MQLENRVGDPEEPQTGSCKSPKARLYERSKLPINRRRSAAATDDRCFGLPEYLANLAAKRGESERLLKEVGA